MKIIVVHSPYVEPEPGSIGSTYFDNALAYTQANIDHTLGMLRKAGEAGADLAVTNEDFGGIGSYMRDMARASLFGDLVVRHEASVLDGLREIARTYGMYVAANEYETDGGKIYNTTKLIGRDGAVVGKYRKVHLPAGERFVVQSGGAYPVFETEIGNIGFAICYDFLFPEHCRILALNGADMVIHQSQGWFPGGPDKNVLGESYVRVRATENRVYIVVAKNAQHDGGMSCVVDNLGSVLAARGGLRSDLLIADIEPDYDAVDAYDYDNCYSGLKSLRARHLLHREPSAYGRLTEGDPVFTSETLAAERLCTYEEWVEIIKKLDALPESERGKYRW